MKTSHGVMIAALFCTLAACSGSGTTPAPAGGASNSASALGSSQSPQSAVQEPPDTMAGTPADIAYCHQTGGSYELRTAVFGTNNPRAQWLVLGRSAAFCKYSNSKYSHIWILAHTLYTTKPTLAVLAYLAKPPLKNAPCPGGANPASCYCTYLGGSDQFGGTNFAGGGWVLFSDPVYTSLEECIFPDFSAIDSWGLAYHSANIIRGINLAKVVRYKGPPS